MTDNPDALPPAGPHALKPLSRIAVILPPEVSLPVSERVYAMEMTVLDDPVAPTERDLELVERLGSLMCEPTEVIAICGLTKDHFNKSHALQAAWARGRERFKARLRLMQIDAAAMGSERMLVHLGKQYLGQSEKTESTTPDDAERKERLTMRDKLADAIDRAAAKRVSGDPDAGRGSASQEVMAALGEGQSAPPAAQ